MTEGDLRGTAKALERTQVIARRQGSAAPGGRLGLKIGTEPRPRSRGMVADSRRYCGVRRMCAPPIESPQILVFADFEEGWNMIACRRQGQCQHIPDDIDLAEARLQGMRTETSA